MSYLYKRNNLLWQFLIANNLTHSVWRPLVEWSRQGHARVRERLVDGEAAVPLRSAGVVYPSVERRRHKFGWQPTAHRE